MSPIKLVEILHCSEISEKASRLSEMLSEMHLCPHSITYRICDNYVTLCTHFLGFVLALWRNTLYLVMLSIVEHNDAHYGEM